MALTACPLAAQSEALCTDAHKSTAPVGGVMPSGHSSKAAVLLLAVGGTLQRLATVRLWELVELAVLGSIDEVASKSN